MSDSLRVVALACVKSKVLPADCAPIACRLRTASAGGAHADTDFLDRNEGSGAGTAADADLGLVSGSLSARLMVSLNGTRGPVADIDTPLHMNCSIDTAGSTADTNSQCHVQKNRSACLGLKTQHACQRIRPRVRRLEASHHDPQRAYPGSKYENLW
jgi:hypothetical protein